MGAGFESESKKKVYTGARIDVRKSDWALIWQNKAELGRRALAATQAGERVQVEIHDRQFSPVVAEYLDVPPDERKILTTARTNSGTGLKVILHFYLFCNAGDAAGDQGNTNVSIGSLWG